MQQPGPARGRDFFSKKMKETIQITKTTGKNEYTLEGLTFADLEIIEEGIIRLFNESSKNEHRDFRKQVLRINRGINPALEDMEMKKQQFLNQL